MNRLERTIRDDKRAALATLANRLLPLRRGVPGIYGTCSLEGLTDWLQFVDPNGCHTQEAYSKEFEGLTYDGDTDAAWDAVAEMMASA